MFPCRVELGEIVAGSETLENTDKNVSLIAMYMYDDTELKEYIKKNEDNKLVVALAYLDNYEEALESVEDVRRSLLIALIDRKITKYFSNFDGLVKKLEKDKYFLIMRQSSLEALKEEDLDFLAESAHADACAPGNPKDASVEDLKNLFRKLM